MTSISVSNGTSYIMPIEGIELSYLNKYVRNPNGDTVPLWSKKRLDGEAEYFQVQILSTEGQENSYIEPAKTYKCHICNDKIPIRYFKKHNQSNKHETLKNIYQTVLERVTKQMGSSQISDDKNCDENVYYCETCCKIIKKENKILHENSLYHKNSEENIALINNFYDYFKTKNVVKKKNDFNENENDECEIKSVISENDESCSSDEVNDPSASNHVDKNPFLASLEAKTSESDEQNISEINECKETDTEDTDNSFRKYLKQIWKKYKIQVPEMDDEMVILEVMESGDQIRVLPHNFHSFRCLRNNYYCQMCQVWVLGTELHSQTEIHVRNIMKPINLDFGRQVSKYTSHCIACNEVVVTDSKLHLNSEQHFEATKTVFSFTKFDREDLDDISCKICNVWIEEPYATHSKSKNHIKILMESNQIFYVNNEEMMCELCSTKTTLPYLRFHVTSKNHLKKKRKINEKSNGSDTELEREFCDICEVEVPKRCMKYHLQSDHHQTKIAERSIVEKSPEDTKNDDKNTKNDHPAINNNNGSSKDKIDEEDEFYYAQVEYIDPFKMEMRCKTCLVTLPSCYRNIVEHVQDKKHKTTAKMFKEKASQYKEMLSFENDKVKCIICDMILNYNDRNVVKHMKSVGHLTRVDEQKMAADDAKMAGEKKIVILKRTNSNNKETNCDLCKIKIDSTDVESHKDSKDHKTAENDIFIYHGITRVGSKYHCFYCQINVEKNYLQHINSEKHTLSFQYKHPINTSVLTTYGRAVTLDNPIAHRYKQLYENLLKHNGIIKTATYTYCKICQKYIDFNNEITHIYNQTHRVILQSKKMLI